MSRKTFKVLKTITHFYLNGKSGIFQLNVLIIFKFNLLIKVVLQYLKVNEANKQQ